MSGRLYPYKQQLSILMAQFTFKVTAFHFNTCTKTRLPLPDCCITNLLIICPSYTEYVNAVNRRPVSASL